MPLERAAAAFTRRHAAGWPTWLLLGGVTALMFTTLAQARWVENSAPILNSLLWGLLFGALLARSRLPGWFSLLHTQVTSLAFGAQSLAGLLPSADALASQPFMQTLAMANARLLVFGQRLLVWSAAVQAGESIQDSGLFILITAWLAWNASAWLAWAFLRRQRALQGALPYGALFGLNLQLSGQSLWLFVLFLALALPMAARTHSNRAHADWERRGLDYPEELGWNWSAFAVGLVITAALGARLFVFFATPEGWNAITEALRPVRQTVEETTARWFAGVNPPSYNPTESAPVNAQTPALGRVGAPPARSSAVVMWVSTDDPTPAPLPPDEYGAPAESVPVRYWRSEFYTEYSGTGWLMPQFSPPQPAPPIDALAPAQGEVQPPAPPGRAYLNQVFEITALHGEALFAASAPIQASGGLALRFAEPDGSPLLSGRASGYSVRSLATSLNADDLRSASGQIPAEVAAAYLQLPASLPQRVRDLASRVVSGSTSTYDMAMRIQYYLRSTYPYNLDTPPPPAGADVVDYFLFQAPGGFCSYYASAMAVMLRSQGVAARVAAGYAMGRYDHQRQAYAVLASDAHAWVEVYFPGLGWVEFEPTAGLPPIVYQQGGAAGSAPPTPTAAPAVSPAPFPWAALAAGGVFLLALGTLIFFWLRRPAPAPSPQNQVVDLYMRMRTRLAWAGLRAVASTTPAEFNAAARQSLPPGALPTALEQVSALYQQAVYSPHAPTPHQAQQAARAWRQARLGWLAALVRALLKKGR